MNYHATKILTRPPKVDPAVWQRATEAERIRLVNMSRAVKPAATPREQMMWRLA